MQKIPLLTSRKEIEIKSIGGQTIFDFHRQVQRVLKSEFPGQGMDVFFSEPVVNENKGEVSWYTQLAGDIVPVTQLSEQDKVLLYAQLNKAYTKIKTLVGKLQTAGGEYSSGAVALSNMLICPNLEKSLFLVNGKPVLTQWGCIPFGTDPKNYDIIIQGKRSFERTLPVLEDIVPPPIQNEINISEPPVVSENKPAEASAELPPVDQNEEPIAQPNPEIEILKTEKLFFPWRLLILSILTLLLLLGLLTHPYPTNQSNLIAQLRSQINDMWGKIATKSAVCFPAAPPSINGQLDPLQPSSPQSTPAEMPEITQPTTPNLSQEDIHNRLTQESVIEGKNGNISLAWMGVSDLDLSVQEPSGSTIDFSYRISSNGGALDIDANGCTNNGACNNMDRPIENVSYNTLMAKGHYKVYVNLYNSKLSRDNSTPVDYSVSVTLDGHAKVYPGSFLLKDMVCSTTCHSNGLKLVAEFDIN